jgi:WD40 repeat protein
MPLWVNEDRVLQAVENAVPPADPADVPPRGLALWNARTGALEAKVDAPKLRVIACDPNQRFVLEGGDDKRIRVRNGRTLEVESEARVHDAGVVSVGFHPLLPLWISSSQDGTIRIWRRDTWELLEEIRTGDSWAWDVRVSADGRRLFASQRNDAVVFTGEVRVFEPNSFKSVQGTGSPP